MVERSIEIDRMVRYSSDIESNHEPGETRRTTVSKHLNGVFCVKLVALRCSPACFGRQWAALCCRHGASFKTQNQKAKQLQ
jgi:hypothetical protein